MPSHCSDDCRTIVEEKIVYVHETEKERTERLAKERQQTRERSRRAKAAWNRKKVARVKKKKAHVKKLTAEIEKLSKELETGEGDDPSSSPQLTKRKNKNGVLVIS